MRKHTGANTVEPIRDAEQIRSMKEVLLHRSYRDYFLFVFGINSGLRISDILPLRVMDVKYANQFKIREQKTGKERKIRISGTLKAEIEKYTAAKADSDYLFPSRKGNGPINRIQAWQLLNAAAREVGIEGAIGTHTLRKTFGYHFYQMTKDVAMLQQILGHSAPSVTLRYIGINDDMVDAVLENFSL
jgi:integrase